ncbi:MAG TPA: hypothetical protein VKQ32_00410 [Polyangia bacterium]|nr:hypothetical protein [Polyangia bacterium]
MTLSLLAGTVAACGRIPGQFEVIQNQVPMGGCTIDTNRMLYRGEGHLDLSLVSPSASTAYLMFPLVINNLSASSSGSADPNEIAVNSFAVDIGTSKQSYLPPKVQDLFKTLNQDPNAPDYALLHYSLPWAATISSGGGVIAAGVDAFPVELAQRVLATGDVTNSSTSMLVNIRVRIFGNTKSQSMESDPFDYPVYVCNGCLVASDLACPVSGAPALTGNACNIAQDDRVDCCSLNGNLICPAIASAP